MTRYLATFLTVPALLFASGCGDDPFINQDVPDINIGVDQISPDSGDEDTTIDRDVVETVDAVCAPGFGFAQEKESEEFDADLMMAGSQIRSVPVYYRDCEGDDADRLVTFELIDGSDFCELKVANDYTDEDGIALGSVGSKTRTGYCHIKACAADLEDVCVTISVFVKPKGIPPLKIDFEPYDGNYVLKLNAVKVRLIRQTETEKIMCADIDPRNMPNGTIDSGWASLNEVVLFTSLPGLEQDVSQDYTVVAMAFEFENDERESNPLRAWSCDDSRGHVEFGDMTMLTMKLWDITPRIGGAWNIDSNFDLTSGLPDTVDKILDVLIGLFTSPTGQVLLLMCDEQIIGLNIGNDICGYIFADAENPKLGEYGTVGSFVVGIIDAIIENLLINNCPYEDDPNLCKNIYFTGKDVGAILQKFRIKSTMNCDVEPRMDWSNPEAGAIISSGDCSETWHTVVFRWSLGKECDPADDECGAMSFSLAAIPGMGKTIYADISGAVLDGQYLQIDSHAVNLKYGALINFALEKILLPQVFGDGSDGMPAVDSYEKLIGSLLGGRQCLSTMSCCEDFDNTLTQKYTWLPAGLAKGACDALIDVAVSYMRDQLNGLDGDSGNFKIGTPIGDPALLIDNNDDMHFDNIGNKMDLCNWDANLTIGASVYDPIGLFWGFR